MDQPQKPTSQTQNNQFKKVVYRSHRRKTQGQSGKKVTFKTQTDSTPHSAQGTSKAKIPSLLGVPTYASKASKNTSKAPRIHRNPSVNTSKGRYVPPVYPAYPQVYQAPPSQPVVPYPPSLPCSIEFTPNHLYIGIKLEDLTQLQYSSLFGNAPGVNPPRY